jgi:hypothetical protein
MDTIENKLQANCSKRLQKSSFSLRWQQQLPKGSDVTTTT